MEIMRDFTYIDDTIKMIMKIYKMKFKDYEILIFAQIILYS